MKGFWGWIVGVALVAGAAYYFLFAGGSLEGVQIVFKGPEKIAYGAPFELTVGVGNSSAAVWKGASLSLTLPTGFIFIGSTSGGSFITKQIGDMGVGSFTEIPFTVMAVAEVPESAMSTVDGYGAVGKGDEAAPVAENPAAFVAELSYVQGGSSAIFQKMEEWLPPASTSGFELTLTAPEKAASGEEAEISITYANKTGEDLDGLVVKADYPRSFVFASASAEADVGDGTWNIGSLKRGSADSILIKGRFTEAGAAQFSVSVARANGAAKYPIAAAGALVEVTTAPLALVMDVNDQPDYVAHTGDTLAYTLSYTMDGLTPAKSGFAITADLFSPLFDTATVVPADGGNLGRGKDGIPRISWYVAKPNSEGGSVGFTVKVKNDYSIRRLGDRNFILKVHGEVMSGATVGSLDFETKLMGRIDVTASGYFRDAASGIVNKGVMPPRVGNLTEYTVHWKLVNYATDVRGVTVRAKLPQGVTFTDKAKSNVDTKPTYDATTREVLWKLDRISATTGLIGTAPEAVFQLSSVPTMDMKGKNAALLGVTDLAATDDFTGTIIHSSAPEVTTALPDDVTAAGQGIVQ
ncbi:MAG: hypothetical protein Q7R63_02135 [bacterium]|nr:hypothetical protein [bacterium]